MSAADSIPDKVHLVGSIGLDTVQEVFSTAGRLLGRRLKRVPDGEPGGRRLWISWQYPLLRANPYLAPVQAGSVGAMGPLRIADGVDPSEIRFGELGYAREARASYLDFLEAKQRGDLPEEVRFQVALPTPFAVLSAFVAPADLLAIEIPYTAAMLREVEALARAIPHHDLCIQWDVCSEMVMFDGRAAFVRSPFADTLGEVLRRLRVLGNAVPADVELGFHLCYGDLDGKHFIDPEDTAKMVQLANRLVEVIARPITYLHLPVPIGRTDDAFFQPLDGLQLQPGTELYLGIVHAEDGVDGVRRRAAAAHRHVADFGIATECGMARARTPDIVHDLLKIHAEGTTEPARAG